MAVSKRLRFEILRRDNHACRYCGCIAPEVVLTVDHVVPVALGGSDDATNLVAACKDCNAGKSSAAADSTHVDDVARDALRWSTAMQAAYAKAAADIQRRDDYLGEFGDIWNGWTYGPYAKTIQLPSDWENSVGKWYAMGLPMGILRDAISKAMRKQKLTGYDAEFRYMAGVVWGTLTEIQQQTAAMLKPPDVIIEHCLSREDCEFHNGTHACKKCGKEGCDWACGREIGEYTGWCQAVRQYSYEIHQGRALADVVDRIVYDGWGS